MDHLHETEIAATLRLLHPNRIYEIRALGHRSGAWLGYFRTPESGAKAITKWVNDGNQCFGIYVTLNELHPGVLARAPDRFIPATTTPASSDSDVIRRCWILFDVDADRPSGISATDEELQWSREIRDELAEGFVQIWPGKLITACSGNGSHLLVECIDEFTTAELKDLLEFVDEGMISRSRELLKRCKIDSSVHNLARITKLYGTTARKGFSIEGRYHRKSFIENVWIPGSNGHHNGNGLK